jgi:hypothetical protein
MSLRLQLPCSPDGLPLRVPSQFWSTPFPAAGSGRFRVSETAKPGDGIFSIAFPNRLTARPPTSLESILDTEVLRRTQLLLGECQTGPEDCHCRDNQCQHEPTIGTSKCHLADPFSFYQPAVANEPLCGRSTYEPITLARQGKKCRAAP